MHCQRQAAIAALTVLTLMAMRVEAPAREPHRGAALPHACLSLKERRAANESGKIIHLAAAIRAAKRRMPGAVVRARLCRGKSGLVYVLTILARDGKVARLTVDAMRGTVIGKR
jgi:hypothetical protein